MIFPHPWFLKEAFSSAQALLLIFFQLFLFVQLALKNGFNRF